MIWGQMGIPHRELNVGMTQDFLQRKNVATIHHKVAGERMAANMSELTFR